MQNELITSFVELEYFANVKSLSYNTNTFNSCTNLEEISLVNITSIRGNTGSTGTTGSPLGFTKLVNIYLPNLETTATYGFKPNGNGNTKTRPLNYVTIGTKWSTIDGAYALCYTPGVLFKVLTTTPPTGNVMNTAGTSGTYMYVPDDSLDDYKAAPAFANWVNKLKPMSECPF